MGGLTLLSHCAKYSKTGPKPPTHSFCRLCFLAHPPALTFTFEDFLEGQDGQEEDQQALGFAGWDKLPAKNNTQKKTQKETYAEPCYNCSA